MPKAGTLDGPRPEYGRLYGLVEHCSRAYPPCTFQNVRDADVTIRIATDFDSAGERCTHQAIRAYGTAVRDVQIQAVIDHPLAKWTAWPHDLRGAADTIRSVANRARRPVVVNFAGNSEQTAPGIERVAEDCVHQILRAALSP